MIAPSGPVRFSHLKAYGRSALHGYHARTSTEDEQSQAMERGTAVHALLFETRKIVGFAGTRNEKHKAYQEFAAQHPDSEILTMADYDLARRMADAVRAHKLGWPLLQGVREKTLLFRWNGLDCRSTPDVRTDEFITELKSAASADPDRFTYHATRRMHYHAQMELEGLAVEIVTHRAPLHHYIVCVEQRAPHPVQVFRIEGRAREQGYKLLTLWAERLKVAEESGLYPPYTQHIVPLDIPEDEEDAGLVFPDSDGHSLLRGIDPLQVEHGLQI